MLPALTQEHQVALAYNKSLIIISASFINVSRLFAIAQSLLLPIQSEQMRQLSNTKQ